MVIIFIKKKNADSMARPLDIPDYGYPHLSSERIGLMHDPRNRFNLRGVSFPYIEACKMQFPYSLTMTLKVAKFPVGQESQASVATSLPSMFIEMPALLPDFTRKYIYIQLINQKFS